MVGSKVDSFRKRVRDHTPLMGTFLKTPTSHAAEILGGIGLDFAVIDSEHAPWDRRDIDAACLASRAADMPVLVRVPDLSQILSALDCGAAGVMVPHVSSPEAAEAAVAAARYGLGHRGFSGSPRSANYGGMKLAEQVRHADSTTLVVAMLEDRGAIDAADEIAAVDGIDVFFLGRGDLTVALGANAGSDPVVTRAVDRLIDAAAARGRPIWAFVGGVAEAEALRSRGLSGCIVSSDQGAMKAHLSAQLTAFRDLKD